MAYWRDIGVHGLWSRCRAFSLGREGVTSLTFPNWGEAGAVVRLAAGLAFPIACASGGLLLLAGCLRFAASVRLRILDSLSENAYSIYLIHYVFVVWLQYALLDSDLVVALKPISVLAGSLVTSSGDKSRVQSANSGSASRSAETSTRADIALTHALERKSATCHLI